MGTQIIDLSSGAKPSHCACPGPLVSHPLTPPERLGVCPPWARATLVTFSLTAYGGPVGQTRQGGPQGRLALVLPELVTMGRPLVPWWANCQGVRQARLHSPDH